MAELTNKSKNELLRHIQNGGKIYRSKWGYVNGYSPMTEPEINNFKEGLYTVEEGRNGHHFYLASDKTNFLPPQTSIRKSKSPFNPVLA